MQLFKKYLRHDFQGPTVIHGDGLGGANGYFAVFLRGPEQSGAKHRSQVVERHLIDALILSHPMATTRKEANITWRT